MLPKTITVKELVAGLDPEDKQKLLMSLVHETELKPCGHLGLRLFTVTCAQCIKDKQK